MRSNASGSDHKERYIGTAGGSFRLAGPDIRPTHFPNPSVAIYFFGNGTEWNMFGTIQRTFRFSYKSHQSGVRRHFTWRCHLLSFSPCYDLTPTRWPAGRTNNPPRSKLRSLRGEEQFRRGVL
ncbi:hypothetical protein CT19431_MP110045 [Cupriavidus taiwanensis]|nr:hypothetical protein CT19431_MP110045 [Cupriavidus taiwanensis]